MSKKIKIVAITNLGAESLEEGFFSLGPAQKFLFNKIFRREFTKDPVTITLAFKDNKISNMIRDDDIINRLNETLIKSGCKKDIDYYIEVLK